MMGNNTIEAPLLFYQGVIARASQESVTLVHYFPWRETPDAEKLFLSLLEIASDNPILRSRVATNNGSPSLCAEPIDLCNFKSEKFDPIVIAGQDFKTLHLDEKIDHFESYVRPKYEKPGSLFKSRGVHLYVLDFFNDGPHIAIVVDHILCDGESLTLLADELLSRLSPQETSEITKLSIVTQSTQTDALSYVRNLVASERFSRVTNDNLATQKDIYESHQPGTPKGDTSLDVETAREVIFQLPAKTTSHILVHSKELSIKPSTFSLTALAIALKLETNQECFYIATISNGRHAPEIAKTIGSFAGVGLVSVTLKANMTLQDIATSLHLSNLRAAYQNQLPMNRRSIIQLRRTMQNATMAALDLHHRGDSVVFGVGREPNDDWEHSPKIRNVPSHQIRRWPVETRFRLSGERWYMRTYTSDKHYTEKRNIEFSRQILAILKLLDHSRKDWSLREFLDFIKRELT